MGAGEQDMEYEKNSGSRGPASLEPDSPCIGYCSTAFGADLCAGCGRTADEVLQWIFMTEQEKQAIWARIRAEGTAIRFQRREQ